MFGTLDGEPEKVIHWNYIGLQTAELWWVEANMVDLLETASADIPEVDLHAELMPTQKPTLVVFERPVQGTDAVNEGHEVRVDGLLFGPSMMRGFGACVTMTLYARMDFDEGLDPSELRLASAYLQQHARKSGPIHGEIWVPLGRTDWVMGESWAWEPPIINDVEHGSMIEDRKWLATLWSLAMEPRIVESRVDRAPRAARRRAERSNVSSPDVRIVELRRSVYTNAGASREQVGERSYHVRWPVKAHWRQQPYGPGRSLRRPQLIPGHIKGPPGAPLRPGATVHVLRDGQ
jgi:hypothetical protein